MSDPPRLRDLAGADDFTRDLLRDARPTRALTPSDAARLHAAVAKAGAATSGTWLSASAVAKLSAVALVVAGVGTLLATRHPDAPTPPQRPRAQLSATHAPAAPTPAPVAARTPSPAPSAATPTPRSQPVVAAPVVAAPVVAAPVVAAPVVAAPVVAAPVVAAPVATPVVRPVAAQAAPVAHAAPLRGDLAPSSAPLRPGITPGASTAAPPTLGDEVRAVTAARAALRDDPARAVEILARAERTVTRPQLLDERDLVHIEALVRLGRHAEARDRALALEARAPRSPQSARARALLHAAP